jgi:hypothetical protein
VGIVAGSDLVSVVVPAYNAERTLDETLMSVRQQSHGHLEIIVVDDGSTDGTATVARRHAAADRRLRLVSIANSGVAVARNTAIRASTGDFIAPIDADDLWHPDKIARQMAVMRARGAMTGFVYTLSRRIDCDNRVLRTWGDGLFEGKVYLRMLLCNFVGNGSSLLIRREAIDEVGGYEPELHRLGAQGTEDYFLQLMIARRWEVGLVPEFLTGYRQRPDSLSRAGERMARSHCLMLDRLARYFPETPPDVLAAAEAQVRAKLSVALLRAGRHSMALLEFSASARLDSHVALRCATAQAWETTRGSTRRRIARLVPESAPTRPNFFELDPNRGREPFCHLLGNRIAALAVMEADFFATMPVQRQQQRQRIADAAPAFGTVSKGQVAHGT